MTQGRLWWNARSRREQWMLGFMVMLAAPIFGWLGIARPVDHWISAQRTRYLQARDDFSVVQSAAGEIRAIEARRVKTDSQALASLIEAEANAGGFSGVAVESLSPENVRMTITAVRSQPFFAWLRDIERRHGLVVDSFSASANSDHTLAIALTLRKPVPIRARY